MPFLKNLLIRLSLGLKLHRLSRQAQLHRNGILVLCLHNISDRPSLLYPNMRPEVFERLAFYIKRHFQVISQEELHDSSDSDKPRLLLTFDDGEKDFLTNALPILIKHQLPAIHHVTLQGVEENKPFWTMRYNKMIEHILEQRQSVALQLGDEMFSINPSNAEELGNQLFQKLLYVDLTQRKEFFEMNKAHEVNSDVEFMDWNDLKTCMNHDVAIGSHTSSHEILTSTQDPEILDFEIRHSKVELEKRLGTEVSSLAFPNGLYDQNIAKRCTEAGYRNLFTTEEAFYDGEKTLIPRVPLNSNNFKELLFRMHQLHRLF